VAGSSSSSSSDMPEVEVWLAPTSYSAKSPMADFTHATRTTLIWLVVNVPVLSLHAAQPAGAQATLAGQADSMSDVPSHTPAACMALCGFLTQDNSCIGCSGQLSGQTCLQGMVYLVQVHLQEPQIQNSRAMGGTCFNSTPAYHCGAAQGLHRGQCAHDGIAFGHLPGTKG
jgi:hypothetical protein